MPSTSGAAYLVGLKDIAAGGHSPLIVVMLVLAINAIMFALAEVPLLGLVWAPERTDVLIRRTNDWVSSHGRQIAAGLCGILGVYLVVRGISNAQ